MKFLLRFFIFLNKLLRSIAIRILPKETLRGQFFANRKLKEHADYLQGDIVNVSGWDDRDAEGGFYQDYFKYKTSYLVTNAQTETKGFGSGNNLNKNEKELNLESDLPESMCGQFDVVLNICTLEHIYYIETAFKNLCAMSRDAVVLVMPAIQQIHIADYGDYWRMTTLGVFKKFKEYGFTPLVIEANDQPFYPTYVFAIAVRDPNKYKEKIPLDINLQMGSSLFGSSLKERYIKTLIDK